MRRTYKRPPAVVPATADWAGGTLAEYATQPVKVKTGRTGPQPTVSAVLWSGTAEVSCYHVARVPAALVSTDWGLLAIVALRGNQWEQRWWDARCVDSREWSAEGEAASQINAILATADGHHEIAYRDLSDRVQRGMYAI